MTGRGLGRLVTVLAVGACLCAGCGRRANESGSLARPQTYYLAVSRDGTQVAFQLSVPERQSTPPKGLYVVSVSTGQARCLVRGSRKPLLLVRTPEWLPDSRGLVYASLDDRFFSIWRKSLDESSPEKLVESRTENLSYPLPSPDGRWVAYWAQQLGQSGMQLAVVAADGSRRSVVADLAMNAHSTALMQWGAASKRLYFIAGDSEAATNSVRFATLVEDRFVVGSSRLYESPDLVGCAVSPDGKQLLLTLLRGDHASLVAAPVAEPTKQTLVEDHVEALVGVPQWAPDGKALCYLRDGPNNVVLVAVSWPSGQKRVLASRIHELPWTGAWTPQGLIVFRRDGSEVWTVRSDGTNEKLVFSADSSISP